MAHKIIVADDSQTIQKVIKITFAQHEVELIPCLSEKELMEKMDDSVSLVLLDFSLSETKSGYELGKILNETYEKIPVMALLGTFDSVDEEKFRRSGYADKVIKPFETEGFINKCERLLDTSENIEEYKEVDDSENDLNEWSVQSTVEHEEMFPEQEEIHEETVTNDKPVNELARELGGWGLEKPAEQPDDITNYYDEFPPVIASGEQITSKFLSTDSLIDIDDNSALEYGDDILSEGSEDNASNDFWAVDAQDIQDTQDDHDEEVYSEDEIEEDNNIHEDEAFSEVEEDKIRLSHELPEGLERDLKAELAPLVEKYVKKYCEENVEKIIWEIVPDLAENLIRKELKHISKSVVDSVVN